MGPAVDPGHVAADGPVAVPLRGGRDPVRRRTVLRGAYAHVVYLHLGASEQKLARIRESVLTLTRGWDQARVRDIVAETLEAVVDPIIFSEAMELIAEHKAAGRRVFIVS